MTEIMERTLSIISASRPVTLVDLAGPGLAHLGADARLFAGGHHISRMWSRAFHDHSSTPDEILYLARHDPSRRAIALFQRDDLAGWSTSLGFDVLGQVLSIDQVTLIP